MTVHLRAAMDDALLVTTDSRVVHKTLASLGHTVDGDALYGPDLMAAVLGQAATRGVRIGLLGATRVTLDAAKTRARHEHPALDIVFDEAPHVSDPDRLDADLIDAINTSRCQLLLVSLGCPKQERWMRAAHPRLAATAIGLGGAFGFYAGTERRSPPWVHRNGLEWAYRLAADPKRLLGRYLKTNPRFALRAARARLRHWRGATSRAEAPYGPPSP